MSMTKRVPRVGDAISSREAEVLDALALGLTNNAMAANLSISAQTVKNHLKSIYVKLGVTNRTEAAIAWLHQRSYHPSRHPA